MTHELFAYFLQLTIVYGPLAWIASAVYRSPELRTAFGRAFGMLGNIICSDLDRLVGRNRVRN